MSTIDHMASLEEGNNADGEGRRTPFNKNDRRIVQVAGIALLSFMGVLCESRPREAKVHKASESQKQGDKNISEQLQTPENRLNKLVSKCVSSCKGDDADLLCGPICERPLNPQKIYKAAQQLSSPEAREHMVLITQELQKNPHLAPHVVRAVQHHIASLSWKARLASLVMPTNDPVWSDQGQILKTAEGFLELHEARKREKNMVEPQK